MEDGDRKSTERVEGQEVMERAERAGLLRDPIAVL